VRFGREVVEVVTFRGAATAEDAEHQQTDSGRILRDNVYGAIEADVWRRDFTVNALYYNIADFTVWDYTTGLADVASRTLRLIGEPETRYREDPVRMLRAVRLAAKLEFDIAPETAEPIERLGGLLREVPPARLFEETLKLFQAGHAVRTFELLMKYGLLRYLFPYTADAIAGDASDGVLRLIRSGLENTDRRVRSEQSVTPMFLYAVMLWHAIRAEATRIEAQDGCSETEALLRASDTIVSGQQRYTAFPKRFSLPMKDILVMQQKFTSRRGARAQRLLEHKRFRAAYDFLVLRAQCGEVDAELASWWSEVQAMPEQEQQKAFDVKRTRRRRSRRRSGRREAQASPTS
jgi:poly(A) polymerase